MTDSEKPAALARIVELANELEVGNPRARRLVRDLFAAFSEVMAHFEAPQPIGALAPEPGTSYLVFSPQQGGWSLGQFRNGRWTDAHLSARALIPTHWSRVPQAPAGLAAAQPAGACAAGAEGISLFITRAQKAVLRQNGFDDEQIRTMLPEEAHRHLKLRA